MSENANIPPLTLHTDMLPYTGEGAKEAVENLTLIHGWAAENSIWQDWAIEFLCPHYRVHLIELPGFGQSPHFENLENGRIDQAWLKSLIQALPDHTHLLGWSLGGLLAQQIALREPERVKSLVCLASTPRFVQNDGWRWAVSPPLMADFIKALGVEYVGVLKQFWNLQLQGTENARPLMKRLRQHMSQRSLPHYSGLLQGLYLLRDIDNRDALLNLTQPTLWLLGEHDPLIPKELIQALSELQPDGETRILPSAGHMPFFSHPEDTARELLAFLRAHPYHS
jgi:putative pimeloyl-BioC--CoA transferase BioH